MQGIPLRTFTSSEIRHILIPFHKKGYTCPNQKLLQNGPSEQIFPALCSLYYDSDVFSQTEPGGTSQRKIQ